MARRSTPATAPKQERRRQIMTRGEARVRRGRLSRRVDPRDHRARADRARHVLPVLREQGGGVRLDPRSGDDGSARAHASHRGRRSEGAAAAGPAARRRSSRRSTTSCAIARSRCCCSRPATRPTPRRPSASISSSARSATCCAARSSRAWRSACVRKVDTRARGRGDARHDPRRDRAAGRAAEAARRRRGRRARS